MPRQSPTLARAKDDPCAIIRSLAVLSDSWSFRIVREAFMGAETFMQFRETLSIASDVLSARLTALVEHGVLERVPYREPGRRARDAYRLTRAGEDLKVLMVAMQQWGEAHVPGTEGPRVLPLVTHTHERARAVLLDAHGQLVPSEDVTFIRAEDGIVRR